MLHVHIHAHIYVLVHVLITLCFCILDYFKEKKMMSDVIIYQDYIKSITVNFIFPPKFLSLPFMLPIVSLVSEEKMTKASRVDSRDTYLLFFLYLTSLGKVHQLCLSAQENPEGNRDRGRQQPPGIRPRNKVW